MQQKQTSLRLILVIISSLVLLAVLAVYLVENSSDGNVPIQISENVSVEHVAGEVIKEEKPELCEEGVQRLTADQDVFVVCLPELAGNVTGQQPVVGEKGLQVTTFFDGVTELSFTYQSRDYKNAEDPRIVDFACLENNSKLQWETCFEEGDDLITINDFLLESGLPAVRATVDLVQLEGSLQRQEFIFVPSIRRLGKTYDVIVPVSKYNAQASTALVNGIVLVN